MAAIGMAFRGGNGFESSALKVKLRCFGCLGEELSWPAFFQNNRGDAQVNQVDLQQSE